MKPNPPSDLEATRLAVAWEIVSQSGVNKTDPLYCARLVRQVVAMLARTLEGKVSVLPVSPQHGQAKAGRFSLTYQFNGGPTSIPLRVFVHFCDPSGHAAFQDDHEPPRPTIHWSGRTSYTRDINVPQEAAPGPYRVRVGLYDSYLTHERLDLEPAQGASWADFRSYEVGTLRVE